MNGDAGDDSGEDDSGKAGAQTAGAQTAGAQTAGAQKPMEFTTAILLVSFFVLVFV